MQEVEEFIYQLDENQRDLMLYVHERLLSQPGVTARIRYKIPFYDRISWICYLNPLKKGGIELAFVRGDELSNAQGILDFKGRKQVCGIELHSLAEIPEETLYEVIQEALMVDESVKYIPPGRRKSK